MEHSVKIARNVAPPLCIRGSHGDRRFFKPALGFLFPAPGPVAVCFAREGTLSKKAPFPSAPLGVEPMPPDSNMKSPVCRVGAVRKPGRARGALSSCSRVFSAGRGRRSFARRDKIGRYFPLRSPARSLSPILHPFFPAAKSQPGRSFQTGRAGFLFFFIFCAPRPAGTPFGSMLLQIARRAIGVDRRAGGQH